MSITFKYENGDKLGRKFSFGVKRYGERQIKAGQAAAKRAADEIEYTGRQDIRAGGNFRSDRWQQGFHAKLSYQSRSDLSIRITHDVRYWVVFEEGRVIHGKPLLWIPLHFATEAFGLRARDYPLPLFRVDRPGKAPLLLDRTGPKYFGKESVTIPKKWHLRQIVRDVAKRINQYYREAFKNGG
jgi:hypothetical protein